MIGIILAGGSGTRLSPLTSVVSKQLLPVYDKPMIYYPLSTLLSAGLKKILIISTPDDIHNFKKLLGTGEDLGVEFNYAVQDKPNGLAEAILIAGNMYGHTSFALVLGDNIFHGSGLGRDLQKYSNVSGAHIFTYPVNDPTAYGVAEVDEDGNVLSLEEKPTEPKSFLAVTGLYFYDEKCFEYAKSLTPSKRGELEITDLNKIYMNLGTLRASQLERGVIWLDTGTLDSLHDASSYMRVVETRQGRKVGCIEEVAFKMKFINQAQLIQISSKYGSSPYGKYLVKIAFEK